MADTPERAEPTLQRLAAAAQDVLYALDNDLPRSPQVETLRDLATAALTPPKSAEPAGEVVVTRNERGEIVAVTRQDAEGHILSVIAEAPERAEPDLLELRRQLEQEWGEVRALKSAYQASAEPSTLRDHFALTALTAIICSPDYPRFSDVRAELAYEVADAMLAARTSTADTSAALSAQTSACDRG